MSEALESFLKSPETVRQIEEAATGETAGLEVGEMWGAWGDLL